MKLMGTNYYKFSELDIGKPIYRKYKGRKEKIGQITELIADNSEYIIEIEDKYVLDMLNNNKISFEISSYNKRRLIINV